MSIAIIGGGISGIGAAWELDKNNISDFVIFEEQDRLGGHANTTYVEGTAVDTGFIVCNPKNYPNFFKFVNFFKVDLIKSCMSFSVKDADSGLEYNGSSFIKLFSQKKNIFNLKFYKMLFDIYRFNKAGQKPVSDDITVGSLVEKLKLGDYFVTYYLKPLINSIWSQNGEDSLEFQAKFVCEFLNNHGMLSINDRPTWYTVKGGSIEYVKKVYSKYKDNIKLGSKVTSIEKYKNKIILKAMVKGLEEEFIFTDIIFACHSNQAKNILNNSKGYSEDVRVSNLNNIKYVPSEAILHTDTSILPENKSAWASWNYYLKGNAHSNALPNLTYNMEILQSLPKTYLVSLNMRSFIKEDKIIDSFNYEHPNFNVSSRNSAESLINLNGKDNIYFAGAYLGYGFHEDGLLSGINSAKLLIKNIKYKVLC